MAPTGAAQPAIYIVGEAPGQDEDRKGTQFVGNAGQLLRPNIPREWEDRIRWNNSIRCWPGKGNPTPQTVHLQCCHPSIERDISAAKPQAIFGFGNVPLAAFFDENGIQMRRGRRWPVKIGGHTCWYYAFVHPSALLHSGGGDSEDGRMFRLDIKHALADVEDGLPTPYVHTKEDALRGVEWVLGRSPGDKQKVIDFLAWASTQEHAGFDIETSRLRPYYKDAKILSAAVSAGDRTLAFPLYHKEAGWSEADFREVEAAMLRFLRAPVVKCVHNLAFEMEWLAWFYGRDIIRASRWEDTMGQASVLDERYERREEGVFSLAWLCFQYFGFTHKGLGMSKLNKKRMADEPLVRILPYNGVDARYHLLLFKAQESRVAREGLYKTYELQRRRVATCVLTQIKGLPLDNDESRRLEAKYKGLITDLEKQMSALEVIQEFRRRKNKPFNPGAAATDVAYVFRDLLGCKEGRLPMGGYTTDEGALKKINHPLAPLMIEWRSAERMVGTYITKMMPGTEDSYVWPDGLLHPILNTMVARTGRLSSEQPNEQNFPKRDEGQKEIRRQIRAPAGHIILACDYGQIEARVIAMAARDGVFVKALWENYDVHMEWAERIALAYPARVNLSKRQITDKGDKAAVKAMKTFRTDIKNQWTFPLFFGAQLGSAAHYLDIPENVLRPLYDEFWETFHETKTWQDKVLKGYRRNGYVECLTGRRRHGPLSDNEAINAPIQGTTADIVMDAMCRISEREQWELQPNLNVHDDLTVILPLKGFDDLAHQFVSDMLAVPFDFVNVPILVEASVGENWCDLEECGKFSSDQWFKAA